MSMNKGEGREQEAVDQGLDSTRSETEIYCYLLFNQPIKQTSQA